MSNLSFNISFDLGSALDITAVVNKQVFPLLNQTVRGVAKQLAANWQAEVMQAKLWSGEKDAYMKSITWTMTGDFSAVVEATYKHAEEIETGRPARDLKRMLDTSTKVRRTKTGKRFLVIPMRHKVSKLESAGLYQAAAALKASSVVGQGQRLSGEVTHLSPSVGMIKAAKQSPFLSNPKTKSPLTVPQNAYAWGDKFKAKDVGKQNKWAQGLYRFNTSTPGGGKSSSYLTFRIMMEGQKGWIIPPQPGQHIAKKVVDDMRPKANAAFAEAIKKQLG